MLVRSSLRVPKLHTGPHVEDLGNDYCTLSILWTGPRPQTCNPNNTFESRGLKHETPSERFASGGPMKATCWPTYTLHDPSLLRSTRGLFQPHLAVPSSCGAMHTRNDTAPGVSQGGKLGPTGAATGRPGPPGSASGRRGAREGDRGRLGAPGAARGCHGPPGPPKNRLGPPRAWRERQGLPGSARGRLGAPGAAWGRHGPPEAANDRQGAPGSAKDRQGAPGAAKERQGPPGAAS